MVGAITFCYLPGCDFVSCIIGIHTFFFFFQNLGVCRITFMRSSLGQVFTVLTTTSRIYSIIDRSIDHATLIKRQNVMHQLPRDNWQGLAALCPEQLFCCPATGQADTRPASSIERKRTARGWSVNLVNDFSLRSTCLSLHFFLFFYFSLFLCCVRSIIVVVLFLVV